MGFSNIGFLLLTTAVFGYFAFNLKKTWGALQTVGSGPEEMRFDEPIKRILFMFTGGFLQKRMFKDIVPGVMHFIIFWGFVTVGLGTTETLLSGVFPSLDFKNLLGEGFLLNIYLASQDIANFAVMCAIAFAITRRLFFPPPRLARLAKASRMDAMIVLNFILWLMVSELFIMGSKTFLEGEASLPSAPLIFSTLISQGVGTLFSIESQEGWMLFKNISWFSHVVLLFGFVTFLPFSKHQHLIWVWPNMLFKSRKGSGRLRPFEIKEDAETFGVGSVEQFTWKQLLDGMTCVECGRCTSVCPANATGKSLDPRLMIHHLKDAMQEAIKFEAHQKQTSETPNSPARRALVGEIVSRDELWACTTCGACMEACPLHIEHIPAIVDMRRYMTMTEGEISPELQLTLQNLETHSNPWGISNENRGNWAQGLGVTTMAEKSDVEYLFWVGCSGSFDENYKKVSQSIVKILQKSGTTFSILGREEKCNGDTARRVGNEYLANMQIAENVETMKRYNVKKIVTGCPHCFNTIKNEYPDFGFKSEVIHHSELIADLVANGSVKTGDVPESARNVTFHDSCYLGRHNEIYNEPRTALESVIKSPLKEMPRTKENGFCCGAGGGRMWMEEHVGERINVNRAREAIGTGASTIATACPFCKTMLSDGVKTNGADGKVQVKDIAEIVAESLQ